jgi:hypothetical protein
MIALTRIRRIAASLAISVSLLAAAVPVCQMVICDSMAEPMQLSSGAALVAVCAAPISAALSSGGTVAQSLRSDTLNLFAAFTVLALAVPLRRHSRALPGTLVQPPPPDSPLGVRILV